MKRYFLKFKQYTVEELINNPSFVRWVNGNVKGKKEAAYWDQWIEHDEHNRKVALEAQKIIMGVSFSNNPFPSIEHEWEQVQQKLEFGKKNSSKFDTYELPDINHNTTSVFLKVAAVIFVVCITSWFIVAKFQLLPFHPKKVSIQTITTNYKEKKTITLSDGSKITLAAGSSISYAKNWLQKPTKRLKLKGEAYFSIVPLKVKNHPKLVVQTNDGTASVWGTQFTVSTYGKGTQVVLQRGKVKVNVAGKSGHKTMTMTPGELARFKRSDRKIAVKHVNPKVYTSWASNRLVFDHTPLSLLVKRIKHTYGVQVKVENQKLLKKKLTGSVGFRDLNSLIHAVSQVLNVDIIRKGDTVYIRKSK